MKEYYIYHGTDFRIVSMNEGERATFKTNCKEVANYLWKFLEPYFTQSYMEYKPKIKGFIRNYEIEKYKDKLGDTIYYNLHGAKDLYMANIDWNPLYQYDSFYLTSLKQIAINYARRSFAFGEIGLISYHMLQAVELLAEDEYILNSEIAEKINSIKQFAEEKAQPVVFTFGFNELNCENLQTEAGQPIKVEEIMHHIEVGIGCSYKYIDNIDLDIAKAEKLTDK